MEEVNTEEEAERERDQLQNKEEVLLDETLILMDKENW